MNVPLLDLKAQYQSIKDEVDSAIDSVLQSQYFIMGDTVKYFEKEVAQYCEVEFAFGCASGSDALLLALMAIDIQPGDYVITTPFTFFATAGAIDRLGAIPIFIDIDPESFNIDPEKVRNFLEGKDELSQRLKLKKNQIKAIIPVHLYGQMAEMKTIMEIAEEFNLFVIEDAAQSIGSEHKGIKAGNFGDFGCFSFFPSKNLGAYGDAGLITVKDPELAAKVDILRLHGARPKYHHKYVGINSRLDAIQAAILSVKLRYLDLWSFQRNKIAQTYNRLFKEGMKGDTPVILPKESGDRHIYHQYTIRVQNRSMMIDRLNSRGIGSAVYYPIPLHVQECFQHLDYVSEDCQEAVDASQQVLSLPIYPEIGIEQVEYVVNTILETV